MLAVRSFKLTLEVLIMSCALGAKSAVHYCRVVFLIAVGRLSATKPRLGTMSDASCPLGTRYSTYCRSV